MNNRVIELSAEFLFRKDNDGEKRSWIKGNYFYIVKQDWDYSEDEIYNGHKPPEKYRFLEVCRNLYAFKIAVLKVDGFSN